MSWITRIFCAPRRETRRSENKTAERALAESLIEEHRRANDTALTALKREVPVSNRRYAVAMDRAVSIIRGE